MDNITYDDVYEIASEVAEETITKFLQNLVKLVPGSDEVLDDIKNRQYQELKKLKQKRSSIIEEPEEEDSVGDFEPESFEEQRDKEFAQIAHGKSSLKENVNNFDSILSQVPLEGSDLANLAQNSPVEDSTIPPAM